MRLLITGGSGLLGTKLIDVFKDHGYEVFATFWRHQIKDDHLLSLDITSPQNVDHVLNTTAPDVVIHAAAYTNVDYCEKNREEALSVNVRGTKNIATSAEKIRAKVVYVSTDYVFDGEKGHYLETDETHPISVYGASKLKGEHIVQDCCHDCIVARPAVIYGASRSNFVTWVLSMLRQGEKINVIEDQYVSPTYNGDLAEQLMALIEKDATGVFHTAGGTRINRYELGCAIAQVFNLNDSLLQPVQMDKMNWSAKRPRDSSLDISKIAKYKKPYSIHESLHLFKKELGGS